MNVKLRNDLNFLLPDDYKLVPPLFYTRNYVEKNLY